MSDLHHPLDYDGPDEYTFAVVGRAVMDDPTMGYEDERAIYEYAKTVYYTRLMGAADEQVHRTRPTRYRGPPSDE